MHRFRFFEGVGRIKDTPSKCPETAETMSTCEAIQELIEQLARLPGLGKKSAERIAFHLLRLPEQDALRLAEAIRRLKTQVRHCQACYNLAEGSLCSICQDSSRDPTLLCVVEHPRDLLALESTGCYRGLYHVLLGRISPLEGTGPEDLTLDALVRRVASGQFKEVLLATNPNTEGDGTALHIINLLQDYPVRLTRLARGITSGSVIEFANRDTLSDALRLRQEVHP